MPRRNANAVKGRRWYQGAVQRAGKLATATLPIGDLPPIGTDTTPTTEAVTSGTGWPD